MQINWEYKWGDCMGIPKIEDKIMKLREQAHKLVDEISDERIELVLEFLKYIKYKEDKEQDKNTEE